MGENAKIVGYLGPMFSGKTTELLREFERYIISKKKGLLIKPKIDDRYGDDYVSNHLGFKISAFSKDNLNDLEKLIDQYNRKESIVLVEYNSSKIKLTDELKGVFFDEIQFFEPGIVDLIERIAKKGINVFYAGLNKNSERIPFKFKNSDINIGDLMARSTELNLRTAVCAVCGEDATETFRLSKEKQEVLVGGNNYYEARCLKHWFEGEKNKLENLSVK